MVDTARRSPAPAPADTVTVVLRGYFSHYVQDSVRTVSLPLAEAPTPRAALARLAVPLAAVGLLVVKKEIVEPDAPLAAGDTLEVLPLLAGG